MRTADGPRSSWLSPLQVFDQAFIESMRKVLDYLWHVFLKADLTSICCFQRSSEINFLRSVTSTPPWAPQTQVGSWQCPCLKPWSEYYGEQYGPQPGWASPGQLECKNKLSCRKFSSLSLDTAPEDGKLKSEMMIKV